MAAENDWVSSELFGFVFIMIGVIIFVFSIPKLNNISALIDWFVQSRYIVNGPTLTLIGFATMGSIVLVAPSLKNLFYPFEKSETAAISKNAPG